MNYLLPQHFFDIPKFTTLFLLLLCFGAAPAKAMPTCQVLDRASSKLDLTLDLFGAVKKTKVDKVQGFLWIDPERPEGARLIASMEPRVSQLFGKFEENPLLIGMLANMLDRPLLFRSTSVQKREGANSQYKVIGELTTGTKKYPADFSVSLTQVGDNQSRFATKVKSDNFEKFLGTPGTAQGDLDLIFRAKPGITKELCAL